MNAEINTDYSLTNNGLNYLTIKNNIMKTINTEIKLDFETFIKLMGKGYSGSGTNDLFTFTSFGGKKLKEEFSISQDLMLVYNNFTTAKQILINQLLKEK